MNTTKENDVQVYVPKSATVELVRNPYIAFYLKNNDEVKNKIDDKTFMVLNQDEKYNDGVSLANNCYKYSNKIREVTNIRYVRGDSEIIPVPYVQNLIEDGANDVEDWLIPYDYVLVTRSDDTQFLISEVFPKTINVEDMPQYSIIRYFGGKELVREDIVYSDGIDISRILSGDQKYVDVFANEFMAERRINESLMTAYSSLDIQKLDETDHGGLYAGYIDSNTLDISSSLEKNELLLFEKKIREGGM